MAGHNNHVVIPAQNDGLARALGTFFVRTTVMLALLTACYYVMPADGPFDSASAGRRTGAALVAFAGFAAVLRLQVQSFRRARSVWARVEALLTVLYMLILVFAVTYDRISAATTDQIAGIDNRTDALYFTVTIVATVGFGDITAVGSAARGLVTLQMLINLVYVGTALRVLTAVRASPDDSSAPDDVPTNGGRHSRSPG